jgi:FlaA1/EpsC-like NDP-sugar epimerase
MRPILLKKIMPRWVIASIEQILVTGAFIVSAGMEESGRGIGGLLEGDHRIGGLVAPFLVNLLISIALSVGFRTYTGMVRYTGIRDISRIIRWGICHMLVWIFLLGTWRDASIFTLLPAGFPLINSSVACMLLIGFRMAIRSIYYRDGQPTDKSWKNRMFRVNELTEITVGNLLERDDTGLQNEGAAICFDNKVVLVSGAAGSIGSEICRQLFKYNIRHIVLLDQSESELFNFEFELQNREEKVGISPEVASVRDKERIDEIFSQWKPDYVFHAAAYKHVSIMEHLPSEAILTNVLGTRILADAAVKHHVQKFIMVSTDKAVNPTNIMGASKSIAEIYIQSLARQSVQTRFITTRFGNVLGSNGSIVPLFIRQILKGGPVTITHPDVTRYFMTIPEASRLVVEACVMGEGGEIFVFDMGNPVRIVDIASKLIRMAGYTAGKEIDIKFIGLRPGEKLHEELFSASEGLMPTYHPKIMTARTRDTDTGVFNHQLERLIEYALQHRQKDVRCLMHEMLPEFKQ